MVHQHLFRDTGHSDTDLALERIRNQVQELSRATCLPGINTSIISGHDNDDAGR